MAKKILIFLNLAFVAVFIWGAIVSFQLIHCVWALGLLGVAIGFMSNWRGYVAECVLMGISGTLFLLWQMLAMLGTMFSGKTNTLSSEIPWMLLTGLSFVCAGMAVAVAAITSQKKKRHTNAAMVQPPGQNKDNQKGDIRATEQMPPPQTRATPQPPVNTQGVCVPLMLLAVFNFIFGGLGIVGLFFISFGAEFSEDKFTPYTMMFLRIVNILLFFSSGIGYLGRKKVLGYIAGNIYSCWAIMTVLVNAYLEGKFVPLTMFWLFYPLLTLLLLNVFLRKEFVSK